MTQLEHNLIPHTEKINQLLARYGVKFGIYKNGTFTYANTAVIKLLGDE